MPLYPIIWSPLFANAAPDTSMPTQTAALLILIATLPLFWLAKNRGLCENPAIFRPFVIRV
jgi:hypothetical protein